MNTRRWTMAALALLAAVLLVGSAGVAALAAGNMGPWGTASAPPGMMGGYGPMGGNGPGGMMGGSGQGGMMGGSGHGMMGGGRSGNQGQPSSGTPTIGVTQVAIQNVAFAPASISVPAGTTVTWTNRDSVPHTVTFGTGMKDSGMLSQGQTFSYTFTTAGAFPYYCAYHPNMTGTVTVTS